MERRIRIKLPICFDARSIDKAVLSRGLAGLKIISRDRIIYKPGLDREALS